MKDNYLLDQIRRLNRAFLRQDNHALTLNEGAQIIAKITASAVLILDKEGAVLASHLGEVKTDASLEKLVAEGSLVGDSGFLALAKKGDTLFNEPEPGDKGNSFYIVVPVVSGDSRLATLFLCRPENPFEDDHLVLAEICAILFGLLILQAYAEQEEKDVRNRDLAEGAFESLSYSEVEAIREILKNINNSENVIIASKIADGLGITRSVIVNALRKFESAGIIESRSLGMKGTFIRVKNKHALEIVASRSAKMGSFRKM